MRDSSIGSSLRRVSIPGLFILSSLGACGDANTEPIPSQPGFVLRVSIPGLTDTTIHRDSLYWRFLTGQTPAGDDVRELQLRLLVPDPPAPLLSPLIFELRWHQVDTPLPAARAYSLGFSPPSVLLEANSNLGTWAAPQGQVRLSEVTDTSISGAASATLEPTYPPGTSLPDIEIRTSFRAPHVPDL